MVRWVKRWIENNGKYFAGGILIIFSQLLLCSFLYTPTQSEILQKSGGLQMDLEMPPEVSEE